MPNFLYIKKGHFIINIDSISVVDFTPDMAYRESHDEDDTNADELIIRFKHDDLITLEGEMAEPIYLALVKSIPNLIII